MVARLDLDPSRPYQLEGGLLAIWLPRGRGRDDRSRGLLSSLGVCTDASCTCTGANGAAILIDDRVAWAKRDRHGIKLSWRGAAEDRPHAAVHQLTIDLVGGAVTSARGDAIPREIEPFFREPIPSWVLDDIFEDWVRVRPELPRWCEPEPWRPGEMLSVLTAWPEGRPEQFVRDGKRYVVDFVFCVEPRCACIENRFVVLEVEDADPAGTRWTQIAACELDEHLAPRRIESAPEHVSMLTAIYLDWRHRSGNPKARFDELRARAVARGAELRALWEARAETRRAALAKSVSQVVGLSPNAAARGFATLGRPGRNEPCPCGSGKKFKRCCAA